VKREMRRFVNPQLQQKRINKCGLGGSTGLRAICNIDPAATQLKGQADPNPMKSIQVPGACRLVICEKS
jgi:hypothetical protein